MSSEEIICEKEEGILTITLNRPEKLNALTPENFAELCDLFLQADADPEVRVIILTAVGERAFCAGDDLSVLSSLDGSSFRAFVKTVGKVFQLIEEIGKPTIAAVNGVSAGAGYEMALACDIAIASENATFFAAEPRIGLFEPYSALRLGTSIGLRRAKEVLLTCEVVNAKRGAEIGLVNKVVPPEQLLSAAREMAHRIMESAPLSIAKTKLTLNRYTNHGELEEIMESGSYLCSTEDAKEGIDAFLHKRKPVFKGR